MSAPADPYSGREQTKAKHFILKRYLQALAFKVLNFSDITYVDGFSGPWETQTEDHSDSSFLIALNVLKDAKAQMAARGKHRRIRCFFSETDAAAYAHSPQRWRHSTSLRKASRSKPTMAGSRTR